MTHWQAVRGKLPSLPVAAGDESDHVEWEGGAVRAASAVAPTASLRVGRASHRHGLGAADRHGHGDAAAAFHGWRGRRHQRPVQALEANRNLRLPKELLILNGLLLQ